MNETRAPFTTARSEAKRAVEREEAVVEDLDRVLGRLPVGCSTVTLTERRVYARPRMACGAVASVAPMAADGAIRVGTSGWSYPSWRPGFYPAGHAGPRTFLALYASGSTRSS